MEIANQNAVDESCGSNGSGSGINWLGCENI